MSKEQFPFTDEQEIFRLAALVNSFCELIPETFDENVDVDKAREIVLTVADRMKRSLGPKIQTLSRPRPMAISAATEHGVVSTDVQGKAPVEKQWGFIHEYPIGNYLVKKYKPFFLTDVSSLVFEHFMESGDSARTLTTVPSQMQIDFVGSEPVAISKVSFATRSLPLARPVKKVKRDYLWEAPPNNSR